MAPAEHPPVDQWEQVWWSEGIVFQPSVETNGKKKNEKRGEIYQRRLQPPSDIFQCLSPWEW